MPFSGGPSLNLQFAGSTTLDPRITFSRTSNATLFDSAGNLVYAPHNLLTFSEQFDNSAWLTKTNCTITANNAIAPDGTTTADTVTATANTATVQQAPVGTVGVIYTASVWIKRRAGAGQVFLRSVENVNTPITVTNEWQRFSLATTSTSTTIRCGVALQVSGDEVDVWGAQLNVGALQPYYSTTVQNLLGYSQEFGNAAWTKSNATVSANVTTAPNGTTTADKIVENTATAGHFIQPSGVPAYAIGDKRTVSAYIKADGRSFFQLIVSGIGSGGANYVAGFDLGNGTAGTPSGGQTSSIVSVGAGWYRCSLTVTAQTAASATHQFRLAQNLTSTAASYTGDGTSGVFIWGTQLSDSASLDPYIYNPVAAPSSVAYYGPRFDYDPTTLQPLGLLIEEQRTNSLRNSTGAGAVVGAPGTAPTNWVVSTGAGITRQLAGFGVENGIAYIDYRFSGTGSVVSDTQFDGGSVISASSGQAWTNSVYCRLAGGSLTNITLTQIIAENNIAGGFLAASTQNITPTSSGLETQRYALTRTLNNALTSFTTASLRVTSAGEIDITIRIGLPQLELGAFATSVIPTTTAAATRAADVATMIGDNFSDWYSATAGTLFATASVMYGVGTAIDGVASLDDNTSSNRIQIRRNSTNQIPSGVVVAGGTEFFNTGATGATAVAANAIFSIGLAYDTNNTIFGDRGLLSTVDTSVTLPTVTQLQIGNGASIAALNGRISRLVYYPRRLANTELQSLTV
jgi:hypothetical protein